ncbi:TfuA-like protein [Methanoculleus chikugoensis]|uniref:TfuA-like protein n=1 Tax=Methanoculleus chikugoensis TaxID=118126 RepID=UPI000A8F4FC7|nr:TfuA-like protein [Methanoculleus chikugoensis]
MTRGVVVFLGPSCDRETARAILDADYRPPAKRGGDITRAAEDGARIIGLIDGVFFQDCAVAHREILAVLRAGVRVIGASSMGAAGRGTRQPRDGRVGGRSIGPTGRGRLVADDEVALLFDPPETFIPLSEPLVNIRATIQQALECNVIGADAARGGLLEAARELYFPPDRTYDAVVEAAEGKADPEDLTRFLAFATNMPSTGNARTRCSRLNISGISAGSIEPGSSTLPPRLP